MIKCIAVLSLALVASASAKANVLYTFTFSANSPFQLFTLTITEPAPLTAGTYTINDTLSNGTDTWVFTQLYIAATGPNGFCFNLGTANLTNPSCAGFHFPNGAQNDSQGQIITSFSNLGGVPTGGFRSNPGITDSFGGFTAAGSYTGTTGNVSLNISPEPGSVILTGTALLLLSWVLRRRTFKVG
jgi:hypothetical protein